MEMAATPYAFYPNSTSFALSFLLLLYLLLHECHCLAMKNEQQ